MRGSSALYGKYVYASGFPANALSTGHVTLGDNQLLVCLPDGTLLAADDAVRVDTGDGRTMEVALQFKTSGFHAVVLTRIELDGEVYRTHQRIDVSSSPTGAQWVEGGFALGYTPDAQPRMTMDGLLAWASAGAGAGAGERLIYSRGIEGWRQVMVDDSAKVVRAVGGALPGVARAADDQGPNMVTGQAVHAMLRAPVELGRTRLVAEHGASLKGAALAKRAGVAWRGA